MILCVGSLCYCKNKYKEYIQNEKGKQNLNEDEISVKTSALKLAYTIKNVTKIQQKMTVITDEWMVIFSAHLYAFKSSTSSKKSDAFKHLQKIDRYICS